MDIDELDGFDVPARGNSDEHYFGGAWTQIKLSALEQYLRQYNTALKNLRFERIYIDAFAGTGRCDVDMNGRSHVIDGSARRALNTQPPFHKYIFVERDERKVSALEALRSEFPSADLSIRHGDANAILRSLCREFGWQSERAVLFLDPYGLAVEWDTLVSIAATRAIDVWYLFPYSGLYRQTPKSAVALDPSKVAALNRVLGTDEWREVFYSENPQSDLFGPGSDSRRAGPQEMLEYVSRRLKSVFAQVAEPLVLYSGGNLSRPRGAPLFALYFAISNPSPKARSVAMRIATHILSSG